MGAYRATCISVRILINGRLNYEGAGRDELKFHANATRFPSRAARLSTPFFPPRVDGRMKEGRLHSERKTRACLERDEREAAGGKGGIQRRVDDPRVSEVKTEGILFMNMYAGGKLTSNVI